MPAQIATLIDKSDNFELVGNQIASILLLELANQEALAAAQFKDANLWKLRVFRERSNPWEQFQFQPETFENLDYPAPIVNVCLDTVTVDESSSNVVRDQKVTATYNIDCYAIGISEDNVSGHRAGDEFSSTEAQRAARLVRNVLMASHYTALGMKGVVWQRGWRSITLFQPQIEDRRVQHVIGARLIFAVDFMESSPQFEGVPLQTVSVDVINKPTGELLLAANYTTE